jgi:hypothetical protein
MPCFTHTQTQTQTHTQTAARGYQSKGFLPIGDVSHADIEISRPKSLLIPAFCSALTLVGNLISNLIFKIPLFVGSLRIGIPSFGTTF